MVWFVFMGIIGVAIVGLLAMPYFLSRLPNSSPR